LKSVVVYKLKSGTVLDVIEGQFQECKFSPCGDFDLSKGGFANTVEGVLVSDIQQRKVLNYVTQEKKVSKPEMKRRVKGLVAHYVEEYGTQPNKKMIQSFEDEVVNQLLPITPAGDEKNHTVVISSEYVYIEGSVKEAELITAHLRKALGSLPVVLLETSENASQALTRIVKDEIHSDDLVLGDKVTLLTPEELKVSQTSGSLYDSPAIESVKDGATVTSVQLEYNGFTLLTLKDDMTVSGIKYSKDMTAEVDDGDSVTVLMLQINEVVKAVDALVKEFGGVSVAE
jgi:recombination associated protein RdgC